MNIQEPITHPYSWLSDTNSVVSAPLGLACTCPAAACAREASERCSLCAFLADHFHPLAIGSVGLFEWRRLVFGGHASSNSNGSFCASSSLSRAGGLLPSLLFNLARLSTAPSPLTSRSSPCALVLRGAGRVPTSVISVTPFAQMRGQAVRQRKSGMLAEA